jgi:exosome complex RNA-binding protein Rrp4
MLSCSNLNIRRNRADVALPTHPELGRRNRRLGNLSAGETASIRPALVCRSAQAKAAANATKTATTTIVTSNASVASRPSWVI